MDTSVYKAVWGSGGECSVLKALCRPTEVQKCQSSLCGAHNSAREQSNKTKELDTPRNEPQLLDYVGLNQ